MPNSLYCILGNTPALSLLELETLFPGQVELVLPTLASIADNSTENSNAARLLAITGGTFKVLSEIVSFNASAVDAAGLTDWIADFLKEKATKPQFGIHCIGFEEQLTDERDIKQALKDKGSSCRFVDSSATGISSALFLHHPEIFDLLVVKAKDKVLVLQTQVVQNIDLWTKRDRQKPYADRKKGMLPPKVARMMVVIGAGLPYSSYSDTAEQGVVTTTEKTLLDPFSGTGTIVMEAAVLGFQAIGSDASKETTAYAQDNADWLAKEWPLPHAIELFTADATASSLSDRLPNKVDAIITEPFLGKPKADFRQLPNIYKGLEKLYFGAFRRWRNVLKANGRVCIVFPTVDTGKHVYSLESLIDKIADLGYTITSGPVEYARTQATTRRHIYVFEFKQTDQKK